MSYSHMMRVFDSDLYANERGSERSRRRFLLVVMALLTHDSEGCDSKSCGGEEQEHPGGFEQRGGYDGWCWAGQDTLAQRAGMNPKNLSKVIDSIAKDGLIQSRKYQDKWGHWHRQYKLDFQAIGRKHTVITAKEWREIDRILAEELEPCVPGCDCEDCYEDEPAFSPLTKEWDGKEWENPPLIYDGRPIRHRADRLSSWMRKPSVMDDDKPPVMDEKASRHG